MSGPASHGAADRHRDGPGPRAVGLLAAVVVRRLPAGADPERGEGAVLRADVGLRARPDQHLPDRRGREHDDADVAGDRGLRPGVPAPLGDPARTARTPPRRAERAIAGSGRRDQLRDVASGDRAGRTSRSSRWSCGCPATCSAGEAERISKLTALRIPGGDGLPRAAVGASSAGSLGGLEDGTITPDDAPNDRRVRPRPRPEHLRRAHPRARAEALRSRAEILLDIRVVHRGEPRRPRSGAGADRPCELHLDAVPPQAVRGGGDERVPVDPHRPAGALPARPARSRARHQTILAIASRWGLPGPQHFSRLFRAAYGCSPSELRRRALARPCELAEVTTAR